MPTGYCTVADVRRALQETVSEFDSGAWGADSNQVVVDAIVAQSEWLRTKTGRHWYESGGLSEDDQNLVPTGVRTRTTEEQDIPSTPHPQHSTLFNADRGRYPLKTHGPYTRVPLDKQAADSLTNLEVRDSTGEFTDWVAAGDKTQGDDYELYVEPGDASSPSYLNLRVASLPPLAHYDGAVRVSYEYGIDGLSRTVRRAVAFRAGAELLMDDQANLGIPENSQLVSAESKKQAMETKAEELLEVYL